MSSKLWRYICYSLGSKSGRTKREADIVAFIRLVFAIQVLITNGFIIYGVSRTHLFPNPQIYKLKTCQS